jgi:hypothetical protein
MGFGGGKIGWTGVFSTVAMTALAAPAWGQPNAAGQGTASPAASAPAASAPAAATENARGGADSNAAAGSAPAPGAAAASPDPMSPMRFMDGPSLRETGRIAVTPTPMPMNGIENDAAPSSPSPKEKSIARAASSIDTGPVARPTGTIDARVLNREIADHFQDIAGCRVDVARAKQVMPAQIVADKLLLRWTIEPDGSTGATDVVAIQPVDLGIMDCAKRVMSQWTFTRPRGGPLTVERPYSF